MRITAYADTDVGRHRDHNEDNLFKGTTVFAVADGMGGHAAGEVASEQALRPIGELDGLTFDDAKAATEALRDAIQAANRTVVEKAEDDPNLAGMGTTLTAVMVRDGRLHLAHVGDSRAYLLRRDEAIDQLTTDHTLVEQLVQDGRLSRDEIAHHPQRSVITRAIGVDRTVEVDTLPPIVLQPGDQVLLCSDGLTGPVTDDEITEVLAEPDGRAAVRRLIDAANANGGPDNITVVLLRVDEDEAAIAGGAAVHVDDEAPTAEVSGEPLRSIPIRTRPESEGHDWARDMGRYGDRQGVDGGTGLDHSRRGRRILAVVFGALIIIGVLGAGGYLLLSRAFFLGESNGNVAIFNGVPQEVAGVELFRLLETTDVPLSALPAHQQDRLRDGITVASRDEADATVQGYRSEIEGEGGGSGAAPKPAPSP